MLLIPEDLQAGWGWLCYILWVWVCSDLDQRVNWDIVFSEWWQEHKSTNPTTQTHFKASACIPSNTSCSKLFTWPCPKSRSGELHSLHGGWGDKVHIFVMYLFNHITSGLCCLPTWLPLACSAEPSSFA